MIRPNPRADARTILGALAYYGILTPVHEPEVRLLPDFIRRGAQVLDIGAGVGLYTFPLARIVGPEGRVVAFEPFAPSARRLAGVARFLELRNVDLVPSLLSDRPGEAKLSVPTNRGGRVFDQWAHVSTAAEPSGQRTPSTTVDQEVESRRLPHVDFIKCDVEGYESIVFRGAERTVRTFHPAILCEIEQRWCGRYGFDADQVLEQIRGLGDYRVAVYDRGKLHPVEGVDPKFNDYFFLV